MFSLVIDAPSRPTKRPVQLFRRLQLFADRTKVVIKGASLSFVAFLHLFLLWWQVLIRGFSALLIRWENSSWVSKRSTLQISTHSKKVNFRIGALFSFFFFFFFFFFVGRSFTRWGGSLNSRGFLPTLFFFPTAKWRRGFVLPIFGWGENCSVLTLGFLGIRWW